MTCIVVSPLEDLTPRQLEVLHFVAEGLENSEIASRMFITAQTVKYHLTDAFRELGVRNRVEAAITYHIWAATV